LLLPVLRNCHWFKIILCENAEKANSIKASEKVVFVTLEKIFVIMNCAEIFNTKLLEALKIGLKSGKTKLTFIAPTLRSGQ